MAVPVDRRLERAAPARELVSFREIEPVRSALFSRLKTFVEASPRIWSAAWWLAHKTPWLLPHDQSYRGVVHLDVPDGSLVLDVGANTGISALYFLRTFPRARVLSLEPNYAHEPYLHAISRRAAQFEFQLIGAGEVEAELRLYTPVLRGTVLHTFSSLDENQVRAAVAKTYSPRLLGQVQIKCSTCKIVPIDNLGVAPSLIKIDAEAHELQVMRGARRTLEVVRPSVLFEASHVDLSEIRTLLTELDFDILQYNPGADSFERFDSAAVPYYSGARNLYALPSEKVAQLKLPGLDLGQAK